MTKEEVIAIIEEYTSKNKASFNVQNHRHNGSDTNKVFMGDLAYDSRGLMFPTTQGDNPNMVISITPNISREMMDLSIVPPWSGIVGTNLDTNLILGGATSQAYFKSIYGASRTFTTFLVGEDFNLTQINTEYRMLPSSFDIMSTAVGGAGTGWYLRLPDNTVLPAAPLPGDICMYLGILQVCQVAGVWTPK